ncbi:MAG: hypothetical protein K8R36_13605 [Planctomycetales bacterium]|nr:hypothetical protein [Planctomycetales bacterium]
MNAMVTTTYKRRWYQFSLRSLLAAMVLASIVSAWLAHERNEVRKRQEAIAAIEEQGGHVLYNNAYAFRPRWLQLLLGDDSEGEVEVASVGDNATDAGLVHLASLTKLRGLYCDNRKITDAGLVHLAGLTNLEMVDLMYTRVSDAGLAHLTGLRKLTFLQLDETQVTDQGVRELKRSLPNVAIARIPDDR